MQSRKSTSTARRARRLPLLLGGRCCAFFRRKPPGTSLEKIDVRRITVTGDEIRAGHRSWLRLDPKTGRLESVLWFPHPPSYAVTLPRDLSRELAAWLEAAHVALVPYLEADVNQGARDTHDRTLST